MEPHVFVRFGKEGMKESVGVRRVIEHAPGVYTIEFQNRIEARKRRIMRIVYAAAIISVFVLFGFLIDEAARKSIEQQDIDQARMCAQYGAEMNAHFGREVCP